MSGKIRKIAVLFIAVFISVLLVLPSFLLSQDAEEIIIHKTNFNRYPKVDLYINFEQGSALEMKDLLDEDFRVMENNEDVIGFATERVSSVSEPIGLMLLVDTSGSMRGEPMEDALSSASLFMDMMRPIDKFAIVGFSDEVTIYSKFTSNRQVLRTALSQMEAGGETALFDGAAVAAEQFTDTEMEHRYMILLSDGMDTASRISLDAAIEKARAEDVTVYSIALLSYDFNPEDINLISENTGGEMMITADSGELKDLYGHISRRIRNQYKVSYTSLWPNTEEIEINLMVEKEGVSGISSISYANPFYAPFPDEVIRTPLRPSYLDLFNTWWMQIIIYAAILIGIILFLYVLFSLALPRRRVLSQKTEFYGYSASGKIDKDISGDKKSKARIIGPLVDAVSKAASKRGFVSMFDTSLQRAGMSIRGSEFITLHLISIIIISVGSLLLFRNVLLTLVILFLILLAPFLIINMKTAQRLKRFNDQLPDTLQLISGSLKAGYSFNQALSMVVDESKPPIADVFRKVLSDIRMGLTEREALEKATGIINSENFKWTVMAIQIQKEVGGNLAEIMEIIAETIRERERVMNQIKALTAEGRLSAYILIALPLIVGAIISITNREYISLLFTSNFGLAMLIISAFLMIIGIIWIMRIIKVKY